MSYRSGMYRYGTVFIFGALILASVTRRDGYQSQWEWLQQQQMQQSLRQQNSGTSTRPPAS